MREGEEEARDEVEGQRVAAGARQLELVLEVEIPGHGLHFFLRQHFRLCGDTPCERAT